MSWGYTPSNLTQKHWNKSLKSWGSLVLYRLHTCCTAHQSLWRNRFYTTCITCLRNLRGIGCQVDKYLSLPSYHTLWKCQIFKVLGLGIFAGILFWRSSHFHLDTGRHRQAHILSIAVELSQLTGTPWLSKNLVLDTANTDRYLWWNHRFHKV